MERQVQSDSTESVSTSEKEQHMALVRERESRRMNEARAARSRTMQRLMKRTRTGSDTQQRVLRSRK
jgi:hypothetical protein